MHNNAVEWYCSDDEHRTIVCGDSKVQPLPITCYNQTLTPKSHNCSDGIITSSVEINVSSSSATWTCMYPLNTSRNASITVRVEGKFPL